MAKYSQNKLADVWKSGERVIIVVRSSSHQAFIQCFSPWLAILG
jgi:hypothetical protein